MNLRGKNRIYMLNHFLSRQVVFSRAKVKNLHFTPKKLITVSFEARRKLVYPTFGAQDVNFSKYGSNIYLANNQKIYFREICI